MTSVIADTRPAFQGVSNGILPISRGHTPGRGVVTVSSVIPGSPGGSIGAVWPPRRSTRPVGRLLHPSAVPWKHSVRTRKTAVNYPALKGGLPAPPPSPPQDKGLDLSLLLYISPYTGNRDPCLLSHIFHDTIPQESGLATRPGQSRMTTRKWLRDDLKTPIRPYRPHWGFEMFSLS
jgi:hypothetical protein